MRDSLTPLEIASGVVLGAERVRLPPPGGIGPVAALEQAIAPALRRSPCFVSFSGGRDSSAILAVAARLARRSGLAPPIPVTNRFRASDSQADETAWQERVVSHLGLADWVRVDVEATLDCLGPVAQDVLRRHGLLWPFNAHFHSPLLAAAAGGSLLTGVGGDELLSGSRWFHALRVLSGARRARPRDVLPIGLALSPHVVRRAVLVRRIHATPTWLRPEASRRLRRDLAAQQAGEGLTWKGRIRSRRSFRYHAVATASLELLARDVDVLVVHPFLDVRFAAELAALPRQQRYPNRTTAMRTLFGDLLPDDVLTRDTKASFDSVFWTEHSREFVRTWDGGGVDASLVDVDALRQVWSSSEPDPRSFTLAQSAWLAASGGKAGDETVDRARRGRPVSGPPERPRG